MNDHIAYRAIVPYVIGVLRETITQNCLIKLLYKDKREKRKHNLGYKSHENPKSQDNNEEKTDTKTDDWKAE